MKIKRKRNLKKYILTDFFISSFSRFKKRNLKIIFEFLAYSLAAANIIIDEKIPKVIIIIKATSGAFVPKFCIHIKTALPKQKPLYKITGTACISLY